MTARGFTLIELLVATGVFLVIAAAASLLVAPIHLTFERVLTASDMDARARTGIAALLEDLEDAGSGVAIGPPLTALSDLIPVIGAGAGSVTITRIPAGAAQGTFRNGVAAGDGVAELDVAGSCFMQDPTCGFRPGMVAALFDGARAEVVAITGVDPTRGTLTFASALAGAFDAGAAAVAVERVTYILRSSGDSARLVRISPGGADQPLVDHVVRFDVAPWAGDVDAQGTDVTLRVDAAAPALRRGAGVQNLELRASVLLRNH